VVWGTSYHYCMAIVLLISLCVLILSFWGCIRGKDKIRTTALLFLPIAALSFGLQVGWSLANVRNQETYVWRFSQLSTYLRSFVQRQQIADLTNSILLFDAKFNGRQDYRDLENVVLEIAKHFEDTNEVIITQTSTNDLPQRSP
jgi:hypothetical protein